MLVIEDEPTLSRLLSYNLTQEGFQVEVEEHGTAGYEKASNHEYDLILLDVMLPGMNGFQILEKLRSNGITTPIIILTAKNAEEEVVQGLKMGADDYITKPFGVSELLARVSAVMRRVSGHADEAKTTDHQGNVISLGELEIYPEKYEVRLGGQSINLRPKEFEVLLYLAKNRALC